MNDIKMMDGFLCKANKFYKKYKYIIAKYDRFFVAGIAIFSETCFCKPEILLFFIATKICCAAHCSRIAIKVERNSCEYAGINRGGA